MNNVFDGLFSKLDTAKESVNFSDRNFQNWKAKRKKKNGKTQNILSKKLWENYKMCNLHKMGITEGEEIWE
jgi:hypothetical protein